jgi:hypothetical protein
VRRRAKRSRHGISRLALVVYKNIQRKCEELVHGIPNQQGKSGYRRWNGI